MNKLSKEVLGWDGKSAGDIEKIYIRYHYSHDFSSQLIALCQDEDLNLGGTWLLKHYLENGGKLTTEQGQVILTQLPSYTNWESKLHILQIFSYLKLTQSTRTVLEHFLKQELSDSNKFVKAWCYNGLYELAVEFPELQYEVSELLYLALENEPASVKARVRKLLKKGF